MALLQIGATLMCREALLADECVKEKENGAQ
jgi:hypothetical protein